MCEVGLETNRCGCLRARRACSRSRHSPGHSPPQLRRARAPPQPISFWKLDDPRRAARPKTTVVEEVRIRGEPNPRVLLPFVNQLERRVTRDLVLHLIEDE